MTQFSLSISIVSAVEKSCCLTWLIECTFNTPTQVISLKNFKDFWIWKAIMTMVDEGRHTRHFWSLVCLRKKTFVYKERMDIFITIPIAIPFPQKRKTSSQKSLKPPSHGIHQWFLQVHLLPFSARRLPLAKCILNPSCAADLTCVIACSGQPDESSCQQLGEKVWERTVLRCLQPG